MSYKNNYNEGIIFWTETHYEHAVLFDREISHHEMQLASENQKMIQLLGDVAKKAKEQNIEYWALVDEVQQATRIWHAFLSYAMAKTLRCELIILTPTALIDHMIREASTSLMEKSRENDYFIVTIPSFEGVAPYSRNSVNRKGKLKIKTACLFLTHIHLFSSNPSTFHLSFFLLLGHDDYIHKI